MNLTALANTLRLVRNEEIVDFNLADFKIKMDLVFKMGNVRRSKMPQLKGWPRHGSVASLLEVDKQGKIDVSDQFLNWLFDTFKTKTWQQEVEPKFLSGAQNELVASKVARHVHKMHNDSTYKKFSQQYIVSRQGVLLDGHHGWAAVLVHGLLYAENHKLKILRVDMDIDLLLERAHTFTQIIGVLPKEGL